MTPTAAALLVLAVGVAPAQPVPPGCSGAVYRQFDFWAGEWSVTDRATGRPAGTSHIEKLYGGCALRENWASPDFRGGSLNSYWAADRRWHQTWTDSSGAFRHFIGGLDAAGQMVMTADQPNPSDPLKRRLIRLSFTANRDGTVRQYSDYSDDGGASWRPRYDFLYRALAR
jgi:hypothetical protein